MKCEVNLIFKFEWISIHAENLWFQPCLFSEIWWVDKRTWKHSFQKLKMLFPQFFIPKKFAPRSLHEINFSPFLKCLNFSLQTKCHQLKEFEISTAFRSRKLTSHNSYVIPLFVAFKVMIFSALGKRRKIGKRLHSLRRNTKRSSRIFMHLWASKTCKK